MAVTYGFYNSINKDRAYNAIQMSQIFDGIINDGVYQSVLDHFAVRAGTGMNVIVGGGRGWFNHTWTYNDSDLVVAISGSEFEANRIDALVLKVDRRESSRMNTIEVIKGTPSDNPVKPTIEDGNDIYYHPLAYITVNATITQITDSMIENCIGVDPKTPFVTGIIDHVHASELVPQWEAEWNEWNTAHRAAYEAWVALQERDMEEWTEAEKRLYLNWVANQEQSFENWSSGQEQAFEDWFSGQNDAFDEWFANLHYILDGDVAGHLQNEIEEITETEFNRYYEMVAKNTHFNRTGEDDHLVSIVSTDADTTATTTFEDILDDGVVVGKIIRTTLSKTGSTTVYKKTVTIQGNDITQTYTKEGI